MAHGPWDPALLDELSALMRDASICGLGQAAPNPLVSVLKYFPDELKKPLGTLVTERLPSMSDGRKAQHLHHRRPRDRYSSRRDDLPRRAAARYQAAASVLHAQARLSSRRQLPRLHGRDRRRAGARRKLPAHAGAGHEGQDPDRPRQDRAQDGRRASAHRPARDRSGARSGFRAVEDRQAPEARGRPLPQAQGGRGAEARPQPRRHGGQSRRLHPVQSLRPRLPRSTGQRRDRHGRPRPSRKDRVRFRRSDGRLDLRRLRRMRAGLPDRRADAGDHGRRG